EYADAAGAVVQPENGGTQSSQRGVGVGEDVEAAASGVAALVRGQGRRASAHRLGQDAVFYGEEVPAVTPAKGLRRRKVGETPARSAATNGENGSERPTAEDVTNYAMLGLVPGVFNQSIGVEDELAVETLQAVLVVDVEGIVFGVFAGGLD